MASLTGTIVASTELAGKYKLVCVTALIESASDTIVLTEAATRVLSLVHPVGIVITAGQDAAFTGVSMSVSSMTITVTSVEQDGTASTAWGDTTVAITVLGSTSGV